MGSYADALSLTVHRMLRVIDLVLGHGGDPVTGLAAIYLSGGGALLKGMAERVAHAPGVPAVVVEDPRTAAARGAAALVEERASWMGTTRVYRPKWTRSALGDQ